MRHPDAVQTRIRGFRKAYPVFNQVVESKRMVFTDEKLEDLLSDPEEFDIMSEDRPILPGLLSPNPEGAVRLYCAMNYFLGKGYQPTRSFAVTVLKPFLRVAKKLKCDPEGKFFVMLQEDQNGLWAVISSEMPVTVRPIVSYVSNEEVEAMFGPRPDTSGKEKREDRAEAPPPSHRVVEVGSEV